MGILRSLGSTIARRFVYPPISAIARELRSASPRPQPPRDDAYDIIHSRAATRSAEFVEQHLKTSMLYKRKPDTWTYAVNAISTNGLHLEFGVYTATSTNHIASMIAPAGKTLYGFDSFEGLKEDWKGLDLPKGHFNLDGNLPKVLPNVSLIKGWFDATLPTFLQTHRDPIAFCHFDADTYESTALILNLLRDRIQRGSILMFDEYQGYPNWENGEFRAWNEFAKSHSINFSYLCFSGQQAVMKID